jgi:diaminopimelate epimerase
MNFPFAKLHGLGNHRLVAEEGGLPRSIRKFSRAILGRHTGIGADGLLVIRPPRDSSHTAQLPIFDEDGSEAETPGNGLRCAGAFLADLLPIKNTLLIETPEGLKSLEKVKEAKGTWLIRAGVGAPILEPAKIPFKGSPRPRLSRLTNCTLSKARYS